MKPGSSFFPLILSYAAMMALAISINLAPVLLTTLAKEFNDLTDGQLGFIGAVIFTGLVSAIFFTGPIVDRLPAHGPKLIAITGNVLIAVGLGMLGVAHSYMSLLVAFFVMGFGAGTLDMVLSPIVAALQPDRRTVAMNLLHSFYCFGAVVTILIGSVALHGGVSWRHVAFALILLPALVAGGFVVAGIPQLVPEGEARLGVRCLVRERFFLLALAAIFLGGATEISMAYWLPTYAERELHFAKFHADQAFLGFCLAMGIGRIAIGILGIRLSAIPLMLWCCVLTTGLFLAGSFLPVPMFALVACILAGLTGSALWPSTLAVAADRFPTGGATMFGVLAAMGNFGGIVMPWLSGIIADHSTLALGLAASAACPAMMIVTLLMMQKMGVHSHVTAPTAHDHY